MAPTTRSRRSNQKVRPDLNNSQNTLNLSQILHLPDEIYLEIASQVPEAPVPTDYDDKNVDLKACSSRHATLASLSQTCRSLRRIFLRYLWERIEVLEGMPTSDGDLPVLDIRESRAGKNSATRIRHGSKAKKFATELIRQLEIVTIRDPTLAKCVRIVNIVITDHSIAFVLQELARCLSHFTHLHTLQICFFPPSFYLGRGLPIDEAFLNHIYPQIRNLHLSPGRSGPILRACPNVRHLSWRTLGKSYPGPILRAVWLEPLLKVEVFETVWMSDILADCIPDCIPHVCEITLDCRQFISSSGSIPLIGNLQPLSKLQHLHTITIRVHKNSEEDIIPETLPRWVTWGWDIFSAQKNSINFKKTLILIYGDEVKETYVIYGNKKPARLM